eukprot:gene950-578_t
MPAVGDDLSERLKAAAELRAWGIDATQLTELRVFAPGKPIEGTYALLDDPDDPVWGCGDRRICCHMTHFNEWVWAIKMKQGDGLSCKTTAVDMNAMCAPLPTVGVAD